MTPAGSSSATHKPVSRKWRHLSRLLSLGLLILVPVLLFLLVKNLDWQEVKHALYAYSFGILLAGDGISLVSYLVFSSFDLLSRSSTGHGLPMRQVLPLGFVCYAFNLNLGSWVGGVAPRYRLYPRLGLDIATITRILSMSLITNWLGFFVLGGVIFSLGLVDLPDIWHIGAKGLRLCGALLLLVSLAYLLACAFAPKRTWHWRGHRISLPSLRFALLQAGLGALNWMLMASVISLLLP